MKKPENIKQEIKLLIPLWLFSGFCFITGILFTLYGIDKNTIYGGLALCMGIGVALLASSGLPLVFLITHRKELFIMGGHPTRNEL